MSKICGLTAAEQQEMAATGFAANAGSGSRDTLVAVLERDSHEGSYPVTTNFCHLIVALFQMKERRWVSTGFVKAEAKIVIFTGLTGLPPVTSRSSSALSKDRTPKGEKPKKEELPKEEGRPGSWRPGPGR